MNFAAIDAPAMDRVQAIAFGQPALDAVLVTDLHVSNRPIPGNELGGCAMPARVVMNRAIEFFTSHRSMKIRQMIQRPCRPYGGQIRGIEAEEINSGFATIHYIGSHVQLGEPGESGQRGKSRSAYAAHAERRNGHPSLAAQGIER